MFAVEKTVRSREPGMRESEGKWRAQIVLPDGGEEPRSHRGLDLQSSWCQGS